MVWTARMFGTIETQPQSCSPRKNPSMKPASIEHRFHLTSSLAEPSEAFSILCSLCWWFCWGFARRDRSLPLILLPTPLHCTAESQNPKCRELDQRTVRRVGRCFEAHNHTCRRKNRASVSHLRVG